MQHGLSNIRCRFADLTGKLSTRQQRGGPKAAAVDQMVHR
jgi:hypothetical protein